MRKFTYLILITFILISCNRSEKLNYKTGINLNGKRLYLEYGNNLIISNDTNRREIKLIDSYDLKYSKPIWKNKNDEILIIDLKDQIERVVEINTNGEHLDTLFTGKNFFKIINLSISNDDEYLIIKGFNKIELGNIQTPALNKVNCYYYIFNLSKRIIEDSLKVSSRPVPSEFNDPVLNSGSDKIITYINPKINSWEKYKSGLLYIYDMEKKSIEFIDSSYYATWATDDPYNLFYLKKQKVIKHNVESNSSEIIYIADEKEEIRNFRISPDGNYILINFHIHSRLLKPLGDKFAISYCSKLISLNNQDNFIQPRRNILLDSWK